MITRLLCQWNRRLLASHTHLERRPACADREVPVAQAPHEVKGLPRRLLPCKAKRIGRHRRLDRPTHLRRRAEEPVRGGQALQGLVRALEVVVLNKERRPALAVVEVGEHRPRQKLLPHRLPEPLDLAAGLRMVRPALQVLDALAPELLLKARRAAPGGVLAPLVGQNLPRHPVVGNRPRQRLQHQGTPLVVRHHQAHQVTRVIIQKRRHVHPLMAPKKKREEIRLPELVGLSALKAPRLGLRPCLHGLALLGQPLPLQYPAHRGLGRANPEEAPHHVADAPAARLGLRALHLQHRISARIDLGPTLGPLGLASGPPLQGVPPASPILLHPLRKRGVRNLQILRHPLHRHLLVNHYRRGRHHHVQGPRLARLVRRAVRRLVLRLIGLRLHLFAPFGVLRHPDRRTSARWFLP